MSKKFSSHLKEVYALKLLHGPQLLLLALYNRTREGRTPSDIVEMTGMVAATVTMAKNLLERQGSIEVVYPARDGRCALMRLSENGEVEAKRMWTALRGLIKHQQSFYKVSPSLQKPLQPGKGSKTRLAAR